MDERVAWSRRRLLQVAGSALALAACRGRSGAAETTGVLLRPGSGAESPADSALAIVVPWAPGGASDALLRLLADYLARELEEAVVVQNITGAGGTIGARQVLGARPDGNTLLAAHEWLLTAPYTAAANLTWRDFAPVALLFSSPDIVVVRADGAWRALDDLLMHARRKPDTVRWGATFGGNSHFLAGEIMYRTGARFRLVGYEGYAERLDALQSGSVDVVASPAESALEAVRAGLVRPLAVAGIERCQGLTQVPTLAEHGVDTLFTTNRGLFAPLGTPASALDRLERAVERALAESDLVLRVSESLYAQVRFLGRTAYAAELARWEATVGAVAEQMGLPQVARRS